MFRTSFSSPIRILLPYFLVVVYNSKHRFRHNFVEISTCLSTTYLVSKSRIHCSTEFALRNICIMILIVANIIPRINKVAHLLCTSIIIITFVLIGSLVRNAISPMGSCEMVIYFIGTEQMWTAIFSLSAIKISWFVSARTWKRAPVRTCIHKDK